MIEDVRNYSSNQQKKIYECGYELHLIILHFTWEYLSQNWNNCYLRSAHARTSCAFDKSCSIQIKSKLLKIMKKKNKKKNKKKQHLNQ